MMTTRLPTYAPLTPRELEVVEWLARGLAYKDVAVMLDVQPRTVRQFTASAAGKVPGDLPPKAKVIAWYRGASLTTLRGAA